MVVYGVRAGGERSLRGDDGRDHEAPLEWTDRRLLGGVEGLGVGSVALPDGDARHRSGCGAMLGGRNACSAGCEGLLESRPDRSMSWSATMPFATRSSPT